MATHALRAGLSDTNATIEFKSSVTAFLFKSGGGWLMLLLTIPLFWVTLPLLGLMWLRFATSSYALEGDRLFMRRGIIFRSEEEIELYRIKDVKADFSIIQQMFGNGNISIISSDATGMGGGRRKSFQVTNVESARELREELRQRVEQARERRGVREYDAG